MSPADADFDSGMNLGHIRPDGRRDVLHERERRNGKASRAPVISPPLLRDFGELGRLIRSDVLRECDVRMVGEVFLMPERPVIQQRVIVPQFLRSCADFDIDDVGPFEDPNIRKLDVERSDAAAFIGDLLDDFLYRAVHRPWRQNRDMGAGHAPGRQLHAEFIQKSGKRIGDITDESKLAKRLLLPGLPIPIGR